MAQGDERASESMEARRPTVFVDERYPGLDQVLLERAVHSDAFPKDEHIRLPEGRAHGLQFAGQIGVQVNFIGPPAFRRLFSQLKEGLFAKMNIGPDQFLGLAVAQASQEKEQVQRMPLVRRGQETIHFFFAKGPVALGVLGFHLEFLQTFERVGHFIDEVNPVEKCPGCVEKVVQGARA